MLHVKKLIASGILVLTIFAYACTQSGGKDQSSNENVTKPVLEGEQLVARGEFLMTVGGCNDCHTPKVFDQHGMHLDSSKLFSGHPAGSPLPAVSPDALKPGQWYQMAPDVTAFAGPWGISYAANLTPDSTTGIGAWSEETFTRTLRTGKHLGMENGRPILPPMPWYNLAKLSDDDFQAIYAYLRSLPPVVNRVPGPVPPNEVVLKK
jgi:hypothetical protein